MMRRPRMSWMLMGVALPAFIIGLIWQLPMRVATGALPAISGNALHARSAQGLWHDGQVELGCATPNGRMFDCGQWQITTGVGFSGDRLLRLDAKQVGGGRLTGRVGWPNNSTQRVELSGVRLPIALLSIGMPIVEQLQFGGDIVANGYIDAAGLLELDLLWQSEFGEFATGPQRLRIKGSAAGAELVFLPQPPVASGQSDQVLRLTGKVTCDIAAGAKGDEAHRGARCRGEVDIHSDQSILKLDGLLVAMAPQIAPGHYRLRIDAR